MLCCWTSRPEPLDQTLVVLGTEFGRTPRINGDDGWDHRNGSFMCVLAGAGIERWGSGDWTPTATTSRGPSDQAMIVPLADLQAKGLTQRQLRGDATAGGNPEPRPPGQGAAAPDCGVGQ